MLNSIVEYYAHVQLSTFLSTYTIKGELVIVVTNSPLTRFSDIAVFRTL